MTTSDLFNLADQAFRNGDRQMANQHLLGAMAAADRSGDSAQVIRAFGLIDLSLFSPFDALKIRMACAKAKFAEGHESESTSEYQKCLNIFLQNNFLNFNNFSHEAFEIAQMLSIGASDTGAIGNLLKYKYPGFFTQGREVRISPVDDAIAWCNSTAAVIVQHGTSHELKLNSETSSSQFLNYHVDSFWSVCLPGGEMLPGWDFPLTSDGTVLTGANYAPIESSYPFFPHCYFKDVRRIAHGWSADCIQVDEDALFLSTPESWHFGHWIVDFLPRLMARIDSSGRKLKLAIPSELPRKHREALYQFGVSADDLIECAFAKRHKFRSLTVVQNGSYLRPSRERVRFVYDSLCKSQQALPARTPGRNIFLTRNVGTRSVANSDEFDALLVEHNFEKIDVALLSLAEQDRLFSEVSVVMGVFGSDLLSVYHMRPGTRIIELIWDEKEDPVIVRTCEILGMKHQFVLCAVADHAEKKRRKIDRDLVVDCFHLRHILSATLM